MDPSTFPPLPLPLAPAATHGQTSAPKTKTTQHSSTTLTSSPSGLTPKIPIPDIISKKTPTPTQIRALAISFKDKFQESFLLDPPYKEHQAPLAQLPMENIAEITPRTRTEIPETSPVIHVRFTAKEKAKQINPWTSSVIITVIGQKVGDHMLYNKLKAMWRSDHFYCLDLGYGSYILKFRREADRKTVLDAGP